MSDQSLKESSIDGTSFADDAAYRPHPDAQLAGMLKDHVELACLYDALEELADCLPAMPSASIHSAVLQRLETFLPEQHRWARELLRCVLPPCPRTGGDSPLLKRVIEQQHEDEGLLGDIVDALHPDGRCACLTPNTLGYMLRCFFINGRRAMLFNEYIVFSRGRGHFTVGALSRVDERLGYVEETGR